MTSRARLLQLIAHKKADKIGWAPQATATFFAAIPDYANKFGANDWLPSTPDLIEDELQFRVKTYQDIGADFMAWMPGLYKGGYEPIIKVNQTRRNNEIATEIATPLGAISEIKEISSTGWGVFTKKEFISEPKDIDIYQYAVEHSFIEPEYKRIDRELELVGNHGMLLACGPTSPIQTLELHGCKLNDLIYFMADYEDKMQRLFDVMHRQEVERAHVAANSKESVFLCSFVTGCGTLSPEIYARHVKERALEYHGILHRKNKSVVSHSSGENLLPLWNYMLDIGLDAIHGFSPTPEGNADFGRILKDYGNRITVWGGLDSHFLFTGSVPQIEEKTKIILDMVLKLEVPFILGSSDDLVQGTPLKNLAAVSKIVEHYGKY